MRTIRLFLGGYFIASISNLMTGEQLSIFVLSTYYADYILVKESNIDTALNTLVKNDYDMIN